MKKIVVVVLFAFVFGVSGLLAQGLCKPPMVNVTNPTMHVPRQHNGSWTGTQGNNVGCRQPGPYWNQPGYRYQYPLVPLYVQPLIQPQEMISVEIVTADGLNIQDGRYRRIQFYIGVCNSGQIWCQAGATPGRFQTVDEAYRFVERMFCLRDFSLRESWRHTNSTKWYVN